MKIFKSWLIKIASPLANWFYIIFQLIWSCVVFTLALLIDQNQFFLKKQVTVFVISYRKLKVNMLSKWFSFYLVSSFPHSRSVVFSCVHFDCLIYINYLAKMTLKNNINKSLLVSWLLWVMQVIPRGCDVIVSIQKRIWNIFLWLIIFLIFLGQWLKSLNWLLMTK